MAEQDGIILNILPVIDAKGSEAQFREIERLIKERIGKPLDKSFSQIIDKEKQIALGFERISKNRYRAVKYNLDESGKIKSGKQGIDVSERDAYRLLSSPSLDAYNNSVKRIEQKRKRQNQNRAKRQKAEQKAEIDARKAEIKAEKEQLKIEAEQQKLAEAQLKRNRASQFANIIGETFTETDKLRFDISEKKKYLDELKNKFSEIEDEGSLAFKNTSAEIKKTQEEINKLKKDLDKASFVGPFEKLFNTFKRVGFYRLARRAFQLVEQGIGEGIKGLSLVSPEVNKTLSSLVTNVQHLSNSLAISVYPILKLIEPVLNVVTQIVGKLAEGISYLGFQLKITSSWFKLNTDYLKEFNKQSNLFKFDKFESLNEDEGTNMFVEMFESADKSLSAIYETMRLISEILLVIGGYKLITWLQDKGIEALNKDIDKSIESLNTAFDTMEDGAKKSKNAFQKLYDSISPIHLAISGIAMLMDSIVDIINWDETTTGLQKALDIIKLIAGAVAAIGGVLAAFLPDGAAKVMKAISFGATLAGIVTIGVEKITTVAGYAEGGLPQKGSLFVAGEAGAEFVTKMPSGQTGVTNIAQFKQAMVEAIYECADVFQNSDGSVTLYLDGAEIARSKRFKSELNRTNAGLNLR